MNAWRAAVLLIVAAWAYGGPLLADRTARVPAWRVARSRAGTQICEVRWIEPRSSPTWPPRRIRPGELADLAKERCAAGGPVRAALRCATPGGWEQRWTGAEDLCVDPTPRSPRPRKRRSR